MSHPATAAVATPVPAVRTAERQLRCQSRSEDIITLNVGGRIFMTCKQVLLSQEDSVLAAMVSGRHSLMKCPDGVIFIDRNPKIFAKILEFLRTGHPPRWWAHPAERNDFLEEMNYYGLTLPPLADSVIMTKDDCETLLEFTGAHSLTLLYRGSRDDFRAATFHKLCDGRPHTVTVIRIAVNPEERPEDGSTDHVFGGYTAATWNQPRGYHEDRHAFLFSLRGTPKSPVKMPVRDPNHAIQCNNESGPIWGGGCDLQVADRCNTDDTVSYSFLDNCYAPPEGMSRYFMTGGSQTFRVDELEVFACNM
ncbi:putative K+ channel tetramerization subfamily protein [Paratrimastix pyriformis]|uniref:K+ channel tetramerization subfamily protein n=1 Tax=Paratrimastix pyriformis TaxID=342808 RepID=A0ABQ8ULB0_9EUKA|nr:putative K+ channel tetramerization subfamily protein [Paratrimastix pyriformis]|eukprot:GAFH01002537.1.p1 GENE.GAFH01002537.1~~GAFH01002537.1.p1  ORF type:complete len:314 (-),score=32.78 GAFH01002537.1:200-1120(-)